MSPDNYVFSSGVFPKDFSATEIRFEQQLDTTRRFVGL
jgi:hypothetical protein